MRAQTMTDSTLTVSRVSAHPNRLRAYRLFLDGKEIEALKNGRSINASVAAGTHTLVATVDWVRSEPLQLTCGEGAPVFVRCETSGDPVEILKAVFRCPSKHIALSLRDAASVALTREESAAHRTSLPRRFILAAVWFVGTIAMGVVASMLLTSVTNDTVPPEVVALRHQLIGQVAGFVAVLGSIWRFIRS